MRNCSVKKVPSVAMAAADGPGRDGGTPHGADGGGILSGSPQRTHPLQRPQQGQSRRCSQGNCCLFSFVNRSPLLCSVRISIPCLECVGGGESGARRAGHGGCGSVCYSVFREHEEFH